ncbi:hypothetical protein O181_064804 [Austropuccinia psidii MF-1]|uniref:Uncharacterized protein n=1 Tax=Austropuccinia psidii MF-1 TaxID=1389203 RepID=A0A9Q3EPW6_9BASI|nr:hypothetical protein [Austropuccinia psidii MF-1]
MPDGLSRRSKNSEEEDEDAPEFDKEENWIKPHPEFRAKNLHWLTEFPLTEQLVSHHLNSNLDNYQYYQLKLKQKTFLAVEWHKISTAEELLEARARQLEGKEEMRRKVAEKLKKSREDSMKYWDTRMAHQLRSPLNPGDLALVYNKTIITNLGLLFKNKWNGPYRVIRQINTGQYELEELDGNKLARFAASQGKKFYQRGKLMDTKEEQSEED